MPMQNMHDLKDKVDLNLGILSACETAIFMKSPEKIEELAGCCSSFGPSDLFEALAAEATALAANKVWNPKEHLAAGPTAHENI